MESLPPGEHLGLSRRELERELAWMLRHPPDNPQALVKLLGQVLVTLIEKNNASISRGLAAREPDGREEEP